MIRNTTFPTFLLMLGLTLVLMSCGKKQNEKDSSNEEESSPRQISEIEAQLEKQDLFCGDRVCPSYLTKIAIVNKGKLSFCTGFLTDNNVVATASSCLPDRLRARNVACNKDIFFFFANGTNKPVRIGCKKVIEVSQLDSPEPYLWRSDIAYLEMNSIERRKFVSVSRQGMGNQDRFYIWSMDQIDENKGNSTQGILRRQENCQSIHSSFFNPMANNAASPVMILGGCNFSTGNSGSPIFDFRGRVRGIISRSVEEKEISRVVSMRILDTTLKSLLHVTNFACAPLIPESEVLDETECNKNLDFSTYDNAQKQMMNEAALFKPVIQRIEHNLNLSEKNQYLKLSVILQPAGDYFKAEITPKCFKNVSNWINTFPRNEKDFKFSMLLEDMKIKKAMNEFGLITAKEVLMDTVKTTFSFNPRILRTIYTNAPRRANLKISTPDSFYTIENLQECPVSLF